MADAYLPSVGNNDSLLHTIENPTFRPVLVLVHNVKAGLEHWLQNLSTPSGDAT